MPLDNDFDVYKVDRLIEGSDDSSISVEWEPAGRSTGFQALLGNDASGQEHVPPRRLAVLFALHVRVSGHSESLLLHAASATDGAPGSNMILRSLGQNGAVMTVFDEGGQGAGVGESISSRLPITGIESAQGSSWLRGEWLNEPMVHSALTGGTLEVVTDRETDFWRETHYGFIRDSGHFLGVEAPSELTCQFRIRGMFETLYDQAGIMVRANERQWVKAGIELSDGRAMLSSVRTDGNSDWATAPYDADPTDFWMRATLKNGVLRLQVSSDGRHWPLARLCPFPAASSCLVGPMACSPKGGGLRVLFSDWKLGPALGKDLHDLT